VVPQGTIFGPLLFLIHIKDFPPTLNMSSTPVIFADDNSVIFSSEHLDDFCMLSNKALSQISKWFSANNLSLTLHETNVITYKKNSPQYPLNI
jgi:hypothetical protein